MSLEGADKKFLVAVDSDGCVFDAMEIKHKECFIPNIINEWDLQPISKYVRETAEYVNLYSKWRGLNRFPALVKVFELLEEHEEVKKRGFILPDISPLKKWLDVEENPGNPTLEKAVKETNDPVLIKTLRMSNAINETIAKIVRGVPPFMFVRECLEKISRYADIVVVSATPAEALIREWSEHDLKKYVKEIAGQEAGNKTLCIERSKADIFANNHVIMIGDAPGDRAAAQANGCLFYPIVPGSEDESWRLLHDTYFEQFINEEYDNDNERLQKFLEICG